MRSAASLTIGTVVVAFLLVPPAVPQAPGAPPETTSPHESFYEAYRAFRAERLERLTAENGWLTLVGLHWLEVGENAFGSGADNRIVVPSGKAIPHVGTFVLEEGGGVRVRARPDAGLTLEGKPVTETRLKTDADGRPDILRLGELTLHVIRRGDRYGIRIKDPGSPIRTGFKGIEVFPPNLAYRVVATFVPYPEPREIPVPTVLGTIEMRRSPGTVRFNLHGTECALEPVVEDPADPELFFIFKDRTSGKETYPSGRFLYTEMPQDGRVVLDFNRAINPPCAFTRYATCPLPPRQNSLPVRIEAGEKTYGHPH